MGSTLKFIPLLSALLLLAAWLAPNHYLPWAAFYNEIPAVFALLALSMAVFSIRQPVALPHPAIFVFLLAFIPLLQFGSGLIVFLGDAIIAAAYLAALASSIVLGANLARAWGERFGQRLAWVCLIGAAASLVLAAHQWLGLEYFGVWLMDMPPNGRPYANLAQPNNLATLLCLGLAAAIYLREREQFGRLGMALLALMLLSGIAMTRSRMAVLVVLLIAGWMLWGRRRVALRCSPIETVLGLFTFGLLWAGWSTISDALYLGAEATSERIQNTFSGDARLLMWQQLLDAVLRQPVFGYGWNQLSFAQIAVVAEYPNSINTHYGHNLLVDLLVWNGVFLGAFIILAIAGWFAMQVHRVKSQETWFALLFVIVILTHSMLELPHAYTYFLLPAGLCIGIVSHRRLAYCPAVSIRAYGIAIALGVALSGWIFVEYLRIEADYRLLRFEARGIERRLPAKTAPDIVLLTQLEELIKFARTEAREGMTNQEVRWMESVAHRYSYPPALMRYALALGLNNRPAEAALELRRLKQIQPVDRFAEVRDTWPSLVSHYPQLGKVEFPAD